MINRPMLCYKYLIAVFLAVALQSWRPLPVISATPAKLIIGYAAMSARVVPLWIAEEQGILAKYGVDSEQVFIRGAPTLVAGLAFGRYSLRQHRRYRNVGSHCSRTRFKNGRGVFQP